MLIEQVEQAARLQGEAENEADTALSHLETFIRDQEHLVRCSSHGSGKRGKLGNLKKIGGKVRRSQGILKIVVKVGES